MRNKGIWSRLSKQRTGKATPAKSPRSLKLEELEIRLAPATRIWDGGGTTSGWTEAANWEGNVRPAAGDTLLFPSGVTKVATVNNFVANTRFNAIVLDGDGYTLNGNPIEIGTGGITSNAGGVT
ncbi:MAG: hypothetical protein ACKO23_14430, partial [Gemmataceae bacterium]